jgi:hypothetical protein
VLDALTHQRRRWLHVGGSRISLVDKTHEALDVENSDRNIGIGICTAGLSNRSP